MPPESPLFRPFDVRGLRLRNRIVMAPMTREFSPNGVPGPDVAEYYARRAAGGVGLIITEATDIDHPASWGGRPRVPRFFGDDALSGWAAVVASVHRAGGKIIPQLWHIGAEPSVSGALERDRLVSPSGLDTAGTPIGSPMTTAQIDDIVASFARAAAEAYRLGFDGIELNGAHGFLIDQFLWAATNKRSDRYGLSPAGRARFGAEIVEACRVATAADFPIVMRISQWKIADFDAKLAVSPAELEGLLVPLATAGVDVFHCSTRRFWMPEFPGSRLNLAGWVKRVTGVPTITVGSIGLADSDFITSFYVEGRGAANADLARLDAMLKDGQVDLAALGRVLLADANWPVKVRVGASADLVPFQPDMASILV